MAEKTEEAQQRRVSRELLPPLPALEPGRYRHYKSADKTYEVMGLARHSETLEPMVVYKALYAEPNREFGALWVRPYKMFVETVEYEGKTVPRFQKMP